MIPLLEKVRDPEVGAGERAAPEVAANLAHRSLTSFLWLPPCSILAGLIMTWLARTGIGTGRTIAWWLLLLIAVPTVVVLANLGLQGPPTADNRRRKERSAMIVNVLAVTVWASPALVLGPADPVATYAIMAGSTGSLLFIAWMNPGPPTIVLSIGGVLAALSIAYLVPASSPGAALFLMSFLTAGLVLALIEYWARQEHAVFSRRLADANRALAHRASHDDLTGLPNRSTFERDLERLLAEAKEADRPLALLIIDLDEFKAVNDSLGHAAGDRLLSTVPQRVATECGDCGNRLARLGGDEFTMLLPGATAEQALTHGQHVLDALRAPIELEGESTTVGASIGVALARSCDTGAELYRNADAALYRAKNAGRGRMTLFGAAPIESFVSPDER